MSATEARVTAVCDVLWSHGVYMKDSTPLARDILAALAALPDDGREHEHYWVDAPDDETAWHCSICGVTEYPALPDDGREGLDVERLKQAHRNLFMETGHGLFGGYVEALAAEYAALIPADKPTEAP